MTQALLEIACFNLDSAIVAQIAGADRIELCNNYSVGGISPTKEDILKTKQQVHIPLHVMIRNRAGNFVYGRQDMDHMLALVDFCRQAGVEGIVFGALNLQGEIDEAACRAIRASAGTMACTFHRAIDETVDPMKALQSITQLGFTHVLSSGTAATALQGAAQLRSWHHVFGQNLILMPGGGIRAANLAQVKRETACEQFHSAALLPGTLLADAEEIKNMKKILMGLA